MSTPKSNWSLTSFKARAARTLELPLAQWPQACPRPLSASYSARSAILSFFSGLITPLKAVSNPAKGYSVSIPCFLNRSTMAAEL